MKTLEEIKQWFVLNKSMLQERYQVRELGIFGSYIRQEQTETSDVDVLVSGKSRQKLVMWMCLWSFRKHQAC